MRMKSEIPGRVMQRQTGEYFVAEAVQTARGRFPEEGRMERSLHVQAKGEVL